MSQSNTNPGNTNTTGMTSTQVRPGISERLRKDRLSSVVWASVLLWGALILTLDLTFRSNPLYWWDGGIVFVIGLGVIMAADGVYRLLTTRTRGILFRFILAFIFLGIGIGELTSFDERIVAAAVLLGIASIIILNAFVRRK